jgi:hypothetical protein
MPEGCNRLVATEMLARAKSEPLSGFSADLLIIEQNSKSSPHDRADSFCQ